MNNAPCYGCETRVIGCHSNCQSYIDYSKEREELRQIRATNVNKLFDNYKCERSTVKQKATRRYLGKGRLY